MPWRKRHIEDFKHEVVGLTRLPAVSLIQNISMYYSTFLGAPIAGGVRSLA